MIKKKILVVVPCFNEEETLARFAGVFNEMLPEVNKLYELKLLFVNDGSTDGTQKILKKLAIKNGYISYRRFAANAGHQSALRAGIDVSTDYDAVIMLDADMQHPIECVPAILEEWSKTGANIVQMLRDDSRADVGLVKYTSSVYYYKILNWLSGLSIEYGSSDFRLIDKSVALTVIKSPENDLFLRGYFSWLKVEKTSLKYKPNKRFAGKSKYSFKKMLRLARTGILQFSEKPLRLITGIGLWLAVLSTLYAAYIIISYILGDNAVSGWTSLMVLISFCFGVNFTLIGFVGRYLAHSISIQKQRPEYIVSEENIQ